MYKHVMIGLHGETPTHFEAGEPVIRCERENGLLIIMNDGKVAAEFPAGTWKYWIALGSTKDRG